MLFAGAATALFLLNAVASLASPTSQHPKPHQPISIGPHHPYRPMPKSTTRTKTCVVPTFGNGTDDSAAILKAFHTCNSGGSVVLSANKTYTIGTALDLTFLQHVDWGKLFLICRTYPLSSIWSRPKSGKKHIERCHTHMTHPLGHLAASNIPLKTKY